MIKYALSNNAKILFVGINPHFGSYARGIPFSNNKMFWYLLGSAGIIKEKREDLKNDKTLKRIYSKKFIRVYRLNFTNIITRPSRSVSQLHKGEEMSGRVRILKIIKRYKPKVVCFVGRITYQKFTGNSNFAFGWQDDIYRSKSYVMHFPLRGRAKIRIDELKEVNKVAGHVGK
jgi:TDG/mug DNA glycosylase family protein